MVCQRSMDHQNLFFYLWGMASGLAPQTHWFLGRLLSQSLWLPVWACTPGLWSGICRGKGFGGGRGGRMLAVIYVLTLPLALPDLVRESPATSVLRLHQSLSSLICFLSLWTERNFPSLTNGILHRLLFCAWILLPRFLKCTLCVTYSFFFIAIQSSTVNIPVYLPIS